MNIKMQCCGIIIVALLIILYSRRRKLPLLTRKVFHACLYVTLVCLIFDVASIFGIVYRESLPAFLPVFLCKTYIAFLVLVAYMSVLYVATSVSFYLPHYKKMIIACTVFCGIVIGLIYALPIVMHEDVANDLAWTTGPSTIVTYVGAFVFIAFNHIQIVYHKQYIYERQRKTVLIWLIMWIVAAGIQMMNNQLLVVGFACALSVMIIVIQFENPELYLDRGTGLFNYMAYQHYVEQLYSSNKEFYVMAVTFENAPGQDDVQLSDHRIEAAKVYNTFLSIAKAYVFKIQEDEILILFENKEYAEVAKESLMAWIEREDVEILPSHPAFYYV